MCSCEKKTDTTIEKYFKSQRFSSSAGTSEFNTAITKYKKGSYNDAVRLLFLSAEQGNSNAFSAIFMFSNPKYDMPKKLTTTISDYYKSYSEKAEQGDAKAQFVAGIFNINNLDLSFIKSNCDKGLDYLIKSADQNYPPSLFNLGVAYREGVCNSDKKNEIAGLFQKAADLNFDEAQFNLSGLYASGKYVAKDTKKEFEWLEKSAKNGYVPAQYELANFYMNGKDVIEKDMSKAAEWYSKAADKGHIYAQCNLGMFYLKGWGVEKNLSKGLEYLKKAAEQGDTVAQRNLGYMYENGTDGVEINLEEAEKWYEMSEGQELEPTAF